MRRLELLTIALASTLLTAAAPNLQATIAAALADPSRPAESKGADALRMPAKTLAFAGVEPGMKVGEFYPGGGYFTRLLGDVVGPTGHVYAIENDKWKDSVDAEQAMAAEGRWTNVSFQSRPFGTVDFPEPLDLAWVTQNYHDLKISEYGAVDTLAFDRAVFAALKPGGTFFILDHQGRPGLTEEQISKLHRINKQQVIDEVTAAGFKLVDEGTFLHRPADDIDKPIFDPAVRGQTDQYALKFVKPRD